MYRYIEVKEAMTQVSKNPIHKDVFYEIRDDFLWVISQLRSQDDVKSFYYDFFTKTERLMLAKRLAVAMMVHEKFSYEEIKQILHVSTSTITTVSNWLDKGSQGVQRALNRLAKEERMELFWKKVNSYITHKYVKPSMYA